MNCWLEEEVEGSMEELRKRTEEFVKSKMNPNTRKAIDGSVGNFQNYIDGKGYHDMTILAPFQLDQLIGAWMLDMRKSETEDSWCLIMRY